MKSLLNLGLNFSVLPNKLDLTQVLVDFRRFERSALWKEFWYNHENNTEYQPPIFKANKYNIPKNHKNAQRPDNIPEFS